MFYIIILVFFTVPIIAVAGWILNLTKYIQAKRENKENPDTHSKEEMKSIKSNLIISSVIAFILVAIIVGLVITFAMGIAYM